MDDFNTRIDKALASKNIYHIDYMKCINLDKYACSTTHKSKEQLQNLYVGFIKTLTGQPARFCKATDLEKSTVPSTSGRHSSKVVLHNTSSSLTVLSKKSKREDFLAAFYTMEKAIDMVSPEADYSKLMMNINTDIRILQVMMYKLGIQGTKTETTFIISSLGPNNLMQLVKLEIALGLR